MVLQHTPLPSSVPHISSENQPCRRVSCWHILSVALTVVSSAFACFLGARGLTFYLNADLVLEECTSNWSFDFPCHYLLLWIRFNDPERVYDTRSVIIAISLFLIVVSALFLVKIRFLKVPLILLINLLLQVASILLIVGTGKGQHCALIPWLLIQWLLILIMLFLILSEALLNGIYSQYLSVTSGCLMYALLNWLSASVTFFQLRSVTQARNAVNNLNYIHLTSFE